MTLDEIARLVDAATTAGAAETTVSLAGCTLVLRTGTTPPPQAPAAASPPMLRAPAAGVFRPSHPALPDQAQGHPVVAGEAVAFLQVGPCLLPVVAPAAGRPGTPMVADGTLVGYGAPLLPLDAPP